VAEYGRQLALKDREHAIEREAAAAAALDQMEVQQAARRALETRLQEQSQVHWTEMDIAQQAQARLRDVTGLLLLTCGCQSFSTPDPLPPRVVTVGARSRRHRRPGTWSRTCRT